MQRFDLEIINIMNNDATLNASAGPYEGLDRFEARKRLWSDMKVWPLAHCSFLGITYICDWHSLQPCSLTVRLTAAEGSTLPKVACFSSQCRS